MGLFHRLFRGGKEEERMRILREQVFRYQQESDLLLARLKQVATRRADLTQRLKNAPTREDALRWDSQLQALDREEQALRTRWNFVDAQLQEAHSALVQLENAPGIDLKKHRQVRREVEEYLQKRAIDYQALAEEQQRHREALDKASQLLRQAGQEVANDRPYLALWQQEQESLGRAQEPPREQARPQQPA